jgi:hypothetical protein
VHAVAAALSMSVASASVAMSGFIIVFLSRRVAFLRRRESNTPLRLPSGSKVVSRCTNRGQWVLRQQTLPRSARVVAGSLTGVVLLALDFVGG